MAWVKKVTYFNHKSISAMDFSHSHVVLLITQEKKKEDYEPNIMFQLDSNFNQKKLSENYELLEIRLEDKYGYDNQQCINLKASQEVLQLTYLIFSYYEAEERVYKLNRVINLLVEKIFKANSV